MRAFLKAVRRHWSLLLSIKKASINIDKIQNHHIFYHIISGGTMRIPNIITMHSKAQKCNPLLKCSQGVGVQRCTLSPSNSSNWNMGVLDTILSGEDKIKTFEELYISWLSWNKPDIKIYKCLNQNIIFIYWLLSYSYSFRVFMGLNIQWAIKDWPWGQMWSLKVSHGGFIMVCNWFE